ncbi:MAG TPA: SDR family NAD(P)-dependent oxidoreductase [Candidatus Paceibacterota bacterium]|mgnify:CR=1 FL=1|nr:SDR family NAD(P)-dependent oxidoreductase [Candidatus Paceibacterota bacterium]
MRLQNKVAIVTGSTSGIGLAIATMFLNEGARVVFSGRADEFNVLSYGDNAIYVQCDVTDPAQVDQLIKKTAEHFGSLDIMVNNAGVGLTAPITDMTDELWDTVIATNLSGVMYGVRSASRYMQQHSIKGSIVNTSSILGIVGFPETSAYSAAKGGINQLTKSAAIDLAKQGIRVNAIAPGFIVTAMTEGIQKDAQELRMINTATPLGYMGEPNDIAYAALYLASDESKYTTGSILYVDGGWTVQ